MRQTLDNSELEIRELYVNAPNLLKFKLPMRILPSGLYLYTNTAQEQDSLLARLLFEVWGVEKVVLAPETVTITISGIDKKLILEPIKEAIKEHLASKKPAINDPKNYSYKKATGQEQREREKQALKIVQEINLAIILQGGKIHLKGIKGNKVFILMESNPFSKDENATTKYVLEFKIQEELPWVEEVIDVTENETL